MNVDEWYVYILKSCRPVGTDKFRMSQNKGRQNLSYIFIAYTAEQFQSGDDFKVLHEMADAAARNAGVMAYWVGCSCMPDEQMEEDVYRICDVIRGAHSLSIAVGCPPNDTEGIDTPELMLQQWGRRVWTFPEVLLAPAGRDIRVYVRGNDPLSPILVPKNQFAAQVWKDDAHVARQVNTASKPFVYPLTNSHSSSTTTKAT
jgi:hypothetical protein